MTVSRKTTCDSTVTQHFWNSQANLSN